MVQLHQTNPHSVFIAHIYCISPTCFALRFTVIIISENSVGGTKVVPDRDGECE